MCQSHNAPILPPTSALHNLVAFVIAKGDKSFNSVVENVLKTLIYNVANQLLIQIKLLI